jgi:hypothetical protein
VQFITWFIPEQALERLFEQSDPVLTWTPHVLFHTSNIRKIARQGLPLFGLYVACFVHIPTGLPVLREGGDGGDGGNCLVLFSQKKYDSPWLRHLVTR